MRTSSRTFVILVAVLAGAGGCDDTPYYAGEGYGPGAGLAIALAAPGAESPEAVSFLGEPLHTVPGHLSGSGARWAALSSAVAAQLANPDDPELLLAVGNGYSDVGLYRRAIEVFGEGVRRYPGDARFEYARGGRWLTVRELGRAEADLASAVRGLEGTGHEKEPGAWYLLGVTRYLRADYTGAVRPLRKAVALAPTLPLRLAAMDWLWRSLRKSGRAGEARDAIASVDMEIDGLGPAARTHHRHLLMYRGILPPDSILPSLSALGSSRRTHPPDYAGLGGALQMATSGYAVGTVLLLRGDTARAERVFDAVLDTRMWPALGYIAAEAELARRR